MTAAHDERDDPSVPKRKKGMCALDGLYSRARNKLQKQRARAAHASGSERLPTRVEIAQFVEMCAPGSSPLALLAPEPPVAESSNIETVFGADEEDLRTTVISAVKAIAESRRLDGKGRLLRSPLNVPALFGLGAANGTGGVRLLAAPHPSRSSRRFRSRR